MSESVAVGAVPATRRELSVEEYVEGVLSGRRDVLSRTITLLESRAPRNRETARRVLSDLAPKAGGSIRLGITGVPGSGKSTLIDALGFDLIAQGRKVAVLAIDPSSQRTRGSVLGDKTRMVDLARSPNAFIRPSPTSGALGGVARSTREAMLVCEAAGYDVMMIETVGVGQSETVVADMTDFFVLVLLAGAGDDLQAVKRGVLELADMIVVNKSDGEGRSAAEAAAERFRAALRLLHSSPSAWLPPVVVSSARERTGIDRIWTDALEHRAQMERDGLLSSKRNEQMVHWMWDQVRERFRERVEESQSIQNLSARLEDEVRRGATDPSTAADRIADALGLLG